VTFTRIFALNVKGLGVKMKIFPMRFLIISAFCLTLGLGCTDQPKVAPPNTSTQTTVAPIPTSPRPIPDWAKNTVLYEVNIRQFSEEGTLKGVTAQLARLHNLGVGTIWLMPLYSIGEKNRKGKLGSPYSIRDYKAVNPEFGTKDDLVTLIKEAHNLNMKVILDWVPNHTSWDHVWITEHPEYYSKINGEFTVALNEKGEQIPDWSDVCDLDYKQPGTRAAMINAMQYWVEACDIDGFRVDMAGLVPNDFWAEAIPQLQQKKHLFMLAEWQEEPGHFASGFHANYGWRFKDVTKQIGAGKKDANSMDSLLVELDTFYPNGYQQMYFTLNHDENTWSGTEKELYGNSADIMNVLAFTFQGIPMLYNGQEDGLNQKLAFFERDPIKWGIKDRSRLFRDLCALKSTCSALSFDASRPLRIASKNNKQLYAFLRTNGNSKALVLLNLSNRKLSTSIETEQLIGKWSEHFTTSPVTISGPIHQVNLPAWGYQVLKLIDN
jgi:alpha-amylase